MKSDSDIQTDTPTQPITPPTPDAPPFSSFGLADPLLKGLSQSGFERPTEIQERALPPALEGRDLMASAQTGTGKTAAFVLPALQRLLQPSEKKGRGPRVLVLTPTRELAGQVEKVIRELGRATRLRSGTIVGGVAYGPQERLLANPLDLLVATPGRLIDHMEAGLVDTSRLELFVLDEADRMLDMGFIRPVQQIARALPTERQTMLFSATLEGDVLTIARTLLRDPVRVQLSSVKVRHEAIAQHMLLATSPEHKQALLNGLLEDPALTQAIVFTATKRGADRLAKRLSTGGHRCVALHGNMRQAARDRAVDSLRRGRVRILVATDVAARGIDLLGLSHVINFDLPTVAEDYIHRIGRTGRNGATGIAVSLVGPQDRVKLHNIERLTGRRIERGLAGEDGTADTAEYSRDESRQAAPAQGRPNGRPSARVGRPSRPGRGAQRERNGRERSGESSAQSRPMARQEAAPGQAKRAGSGWNYARPGHRRGGGGSRGPSSWSG